MKNKKRFFAIVIILSIFSAWSVCYGLDTELYVLSGVNVPPNVIIILDNSASMDEVVQDIGDFVPETDYSQDPYNSSTYTRDAVYVKSGSSWSSQWPDYRTTACTDKSGHILALSDLSDNLTLYGMSNNYTNSNCSPAIKNKDYRTGNYLNYLKVAEGQGANRPRFGLATGIIKSYTNTTSGVRFGLMVFNNYTKTVKYNPAHDTTDPDKGEYVDNPDGSEYINGGNVLGFIDESGNGKTDLFNAMSGLKNETWSPLAKTLNMTETYFRSGLNGFPSPIQYRCQKNYVLIISDGIPTKDTGDLAAEAARLFDLDLSNGLATNKQNIKTYTVSFSPGNTLMEQTADEYHGRGKNWYVTSSQSFSVAFQTFIADVLTSSTSYVAPVVPISQMERTSAANRMYLAMFQPTDKSFWRGNIKKFGIATETNAQYQFGDILDSTGAPAIGTDPNADDYNKIKSSSKSYWDQSHPADGGDVSKGGVGAVLLARNPDTRKIYTYFTGNTTDLTHSSNAFSLANRSPENAEGKITTTTLGVTTAGDRDNIINFLYGWNPYNEAIISSEGKYNSNERDWILGAFIHSRPLVVHYDQTNSVVFAGANDGMLHAFDDESGEELWAFIPPCVLGSLKYFGKTDNLQFFVDGSPRAYIERDSDGNLTRGILIFGLRRGGSSYIALDITNRLAPAFLWEISPARTGYGELGQTWSTPLIGKIKDKDNPGSLKSVAFIGGGYDYIRYDDTLLYYNIGAEDSIPPGTDTKGRAVYVIDIFTGNCIWSYSYADNTTMKYSIPSDIARVDTNGDGAIDRLYVGDTGGQMWRFNILNPDPGTWKEPGKVKVIFTSNPGSSDKRKIFYPPEVTLEKGNYEMLFFGTGDREHPKYRSETQGIVDRLYGIKDKDPTSPLADTDLVDVRTNPLQPGSDTDNGWYITLNSPANSEEKCLANAVIFYGVVYYTTFVPSQGGTGDICFMNAGNGRLYAVDYMTANAALDLDGDGTIAADDLWMDIGVSIPSGIVITFIEGVTLAYGGEGGGIFRPPTPTSKTIFPLSWRIVF